MNRDENSEGSRFLRSSTKLLSQPMQATSTTTSSASLEYTQTRPTATGLTAAAITAVVAPVVHHGPLTGTSYVQSLILAFASGLLIGGVRRLKGLCATDPEQKNLDRLNVAKGSVGGALAGPAIIKLLAVGVATLPVDAGITLGTLLIGAGGALAYNRFSKKKYCPHLDCRKPGRCNQIVCRSCYRLFYPDDSKIDCGVTPFLGWDTVASCLQKRQLSYLDAEMLAKDNIGAWMAYPVSKDEVFVDCQAFISWLDKNKALTISYRGKGVVEKDKKKISEELDSRGL